MPRRPEGVGVVRQALAGMADALDFDAVRAGRHEDGGHGGVHERRRARLRGEAGMLEVEMLADETA
jgi:serine/threonine-protein kinase RsbW